MSDELRERLRQNQVAAEEKLKVYVHKIERDGKSSRIILSDVASADRDAVIAKREAEDLQEKSDYVTAKREAAKAQVEAQAENIEDVKSELENAVEDILSDTEE